jgi:hypothetical protein
MVRHGEVDSGAGHVLEAAMITCEQCGGAAWCVTTLMDDPNDITQDAAFAALDITITGGTFQGLVAKCHYCGHEQVIFWYCIDVAVSDSGTLQMTNLDAGTANTLEGYYVYTDTGTDAGKYTTIATHTAATPTVITTDVALNDDADGYVVISNIASTGYTAAS